MDELPTVTKAAQSPIAAIWLARVSELSGGIDLLAVGTRPRMVLRGNVAEVKTLGLAE